MVQARLDWSKPGWTVPSQVGLVQARLDWPKPGCYGSSQVVTVQARLLHSRKLQMQEKSGYKENSVKNTCFRSGKVWPTGNKITIL